MGEHENGEVPVLEKKKSSNEHLLARWQLKGQMNPGDSLVVTRSGGEKGLDVFTFHGPDEAGSGMEMRKPIITGGHESKTMDREEMLDINNPVKTAKEWYTWYYRTTGSNFVNDPSAIDDRLMTVEEFDAQLNGIEFPNRERWGAVSDCFKRNLEQVEDKEPSLHEQMMELYNAPLSRGELERSSRGRTGRRVVVTGGDPINYFFQGNLCSQCC